MKDLKDFVKKAHNGKFKDFYRYEIRNAIKFYLAANNYQDYRSTIENESQFDYIILPSTLHTHSKRSFNKIHLNFLITFFKEYHNKTGKNISKKRITRTIKSARLIKDKRAVTEWFEFLEDIGWAEPNYDKWIIKINEKSLYKLLGEDPTGTYDPITEHLNEASSILKARTASNEISRASIKRF